jgi:Pseudouridylate synthases, 23S RNA-specific
MKINIIYEDNHLLVVEKPVNIPVQADSSKDDDLLSELKKYLVVKYQKPNDAYLGLVQRLDRPVGGVMVFAKTSKAAARLSKQISTHQMQKTYLAIVENELLEKTATWIDYLAKNNKTNTVNVVSSDKGKQAILDYELLEYKDSLSLVEINLKTGRSHQIRVQFSHHNHPLWGDQRYNKNATVGQQIALWSYRLSFAHPITKEFLTFESALPKQEPWRGFRK